MPANLSEAGQIYAGSSAGTGGSGTVTLQQPQSTLFVAATEIDLLPSFEATVSSVNNFTGLIDPNFCQHNYNRNLPFDTINVPLFQQDEFAQNDLSLTTSQFKMESRDISLLNNDKIKIYPTISNGAINITGNTKELTNAEFVVYNSLGEIVFRSHNYSGNDAKLNLTWLRTGMYYIQIKNDIKSGTQKIIIQH